MTKNTFFVIEAMNPATGKRYSRAEKVPNCYNLIGKFTAPAGFQVVSVNACDTWKEAQDTANFWNECAKNRNQYAY